MPPPTASKSFCRDGVAPPPLVLTSPALAGAPVAHGFTTRRGGASPAPWDGLNLSRSVGDDPARVAENEDALRARLGMPGRPIVTVNQVHGVSVLRVGDDLAGGGSHDALVTDRPGVLIAVKTADCAPILLWDGRRGAAGAVHAGWRGTALKAPAHAVAAMAEAFGSRPEDIVAVIGPAIGPCCYRVGPDVVAAFSDAFGAGRFVSTTRELGAGEGEFTSPQHAGGPGEVSSSAIPRYLDLQEANRQSLVEAGLRPNQIHAVRLCTACNPRLFFSHRRDGAGRTGRHLAFICRA